MNQYTDIFLQLAVLCFVFVFVLVGFMGVLALITALQHLRFLWEARNRRRALQGHYHQLHLSLLRHIDALLQQMERR
jgi:Tfp pilus assembly protein PilV